MATKPKKTTRAITTKRTGAKMRPVRNPLARFAQCIIASRRAKILVVFIVLFAGLGTYQLYKTYASYSANDAERRALRNLAKNDANWNAMVPHLKWCESKDNYNSNSTYKGAYQFSPATWKATPGYKVHGKHYGSGPASSTWPSAAIQDESARWLYYNADPSRQWPNCGPYAAMKAGLISGRVGRSGTPAPTSAPVAGTPKGNIDSVDCRYIRGWTYDEDDSGRSLEVHVYLDGPYGSHKASFNAGATNQDRPDVNRAFGIGGKHGFNIPIPEGWLDGGNHTLYIYSINVGRGGHQLQTRTFSGCANPVGNIDSANCTSISGWILDFNKTNHSVEYHVYVDGVPGGAVFYAQNAGPANVSRQDVNNVYGITGNHGFVYRIPARLKDGKAHTYRIYGINVGAGNTNPQIAGAQTLTCK